jgi:hypothetical protein
MSSSPALSSSNDASSTQYPISPSGAHVSGASGSISSITQIKPSRQSVAQRQTSPVLPLHASPGVNASATMAAARSSPGTREKTSRFGMTK